MNPLLDIKGEHTAITMILDAMKKLASDLRNGKFIDSYRIVQILDFLHTFNLNSHYEKLEKILYPALLGYNIPWTTETINHLISEHETAHTYLKEIDDRFDKYLSGNAQTVESLYASMMKYVRLEENHIKITDNVILPLCERIFDKNKLKSISSDFKKIQDQQVGHDKHMEYYKLLKVVYSESNVNRESAYS